MSQKIVIVALAFFGVLLLVGIAAMLIIPIEPLGVESKTDQGNLRPTINITLYAGETMNGEFGFGLTPDNITSPGPILKFKFNDIINMTMINVGHIPHTFAIKPDLKENSLIISDAYIGTTTRPVLSQDSKNVVFKVTQTGDFQYVCTVPGHVDLGMHGEVIIID